MHIQVTKRCRTVLALSVVLALVAVGCDRGPDTPEPIAHAVLRDASGSTVGLVLIYGEDAGQVRARATLRSNANVTPGKFHGFHIHANNDASNGDGCAADSTMPATTWFVSADGHLKEEGQSHGDHSGDMPSLLVAADGSASSTFTTDRLDAAALDGKAIVLHAGPDNFGNVPVGVATDEYTANSAATVTKTQATGNAGNRVACGLIVAAEQSGSETVAP